jgi:hypothetical protein
VQNYFSPSECGSARAAERTKKRTNNIGGAHKRRKFASWHVVVTRVSSALPCRCKFPARNRAVENFFSAARCRQSPCRYGGAAGKDAYAQIQAESLLFFSCCSNRMAVFVDSRRHCTYVAIHSSLGGQQWRRREKRKRKRRRRPRSVGRRSNQRRYRSSTLHVSKIASHGPAEVEGGSMIARDRPAQVNGRGRRRDGGSSFTIECVARGGEDEGRNSRTSPQRMSSGLDPRASRRPPRFLGSILP